MLIFVGERVSGLHLMTFFAQPSGVVERCCFHDRFGVLFSVSVYPSLCVCMCSCNQWKGFEAIQADILSDNYGSQVNEI